MYSWKPVPGSVATGTYDTTLAGWKAANLAMYVTVWHEIDHQVNAGNVTDVPGWQNDIDYMVTYFAGSTIKVMVILTASNLPTDWDTYKRAGVVCGVDFDGIPHTTGAYPAATYNTALAYCTGTVQPAGYQVVVGEFGATLGTDDPSASGRLAWETLWSNNFITAGFGAIMWWMPASSYGLPLANEQAYLKSLIAAHN
jgi:hypothetical protein